MAYNGKGRKVLRNTTAEDTLKTSLETVQQRCLESLQIALRVWKWVLWAGLSYRRG